MWIKISDRLPSEFDGERVAVYTPSKDVTMKHRIMDRKYIPSLCKDATHWKALDTPDSPEALDIGVLRELEEYRVNDLSGGTTPRDHVIRVCEAIVASQLGFKSRADWESKIHEKKSVVQYQRRNEKQIREYVVINCPDDITPEEYTKAKLNHLISIIRKNEKQSKNG